MVSIPPLCGIKFRDKAKALIKTSAALREKKVYLKELSIFAGYTLRPCITRNNTATIAITSNM
jgi:hypothetical protein